MAVERKIKHLKYSQNEYKKSVQVVIYSIAFHFCLTTFTEHSPTGNGFLHEFMTFISRV